MGILRATEQLESFQLTKVRRVDGLLGERRNSLKLLDNSYPPSIMTSFVSFHTLEDFSAYLGVRSIQSR